MHNWIPQLFSIIQVTTLVSQKGPSNKKKGRSKKAHVLSAAVQKATENFIINGEEIANENPDIKPEMISAVEEVKKTGKFVTFIHDHNVYFLGWMLLFCPTPPHPPKKLLYIYWLH